MVVFIFNPLAQGASDILPLLTGRRSSKLFSKFKKAVAYFCSDDSADDEYEDPTNEEILEWMFPDPDSRPEELQEEN